VSTKDKGQMLRQVLLRRPVDNGHAEDVFWIDNTLARVGKRLRDDDGVVWTVIDTYTARPFDDLEAQRDAWKRWAEILDGH
jgi:hypothetical protein